MKYCPLHVHDLHWSLNCRPLAVAYFCPQAAADLSPLFVPLLPLTRSFGRFQTLHPTHQGSAEPRELPQAHVSTYLTLLILNCLLLHGNLKCSPYLGTGPQHCTTSGRATPKEYNVMGAPDVVKHRSSTTGSKPPTSIVKSLKIPPREGNCKHIHLSLCLFFCPYCPLYPKPPSLEATFSLLIPCNQDLLYIIF